MSAEDIDAMIAGLQPPAPWARQPGESEADFASFVTYRDSNPPRKLIWAGTRKQDVYTLFNAWRWRDRAAAYDGHIDAIRVQVREDLLRQHERDVTAEHMSILKDGREFLALEMDKYLQTAKETSMQGLLKPAELIKLMTAVIQLDRLVRDKATEIHETQVDLSALSDEELRTLSAIEAKIAGPAAPGALPAHVEEAELCEE